MYNIYARGLFWNMHSYIYEPQNVSVNTLLYNSYQYKCSA